MVITELAVEWAFDLYISEYAYLSLSCNLETIINII